MPLQHDKNDILWLPTTGPTTACFCHHLLCCRHRRHWKNRYHHHCCHRHHYYHAAAGGWIGGFLSSLLLLDGCITGYNALLMLVLYITTATMFLDVIDDDDNHNVEECVGDTTRHLLLWLIIKTLFSSCSLCYCGVGRQECYPWNVNDAAVDASGVVIIIILSWTGLQ